MKVSLNWLKDFVDLDGIGIEEIVSRFSLVTAEIEGYEVKDKVSGIVVGEVMTCEKHPTSNKPLSVLTVNNGKEILPIVCGAPNVRAGMLVALANVGARVSGGFEIGKAKLAGYDSHGMCCSETELGIGSDSGGIIELDAKLKVGTSLDFSDVVIEIDNKSLTNRPDLWGHYGIARELAVIFGRKLKLPKTAKFVDTLPKVPVKIESKDCLSYGAFRVNGIKGKSSLEMQKRLAYCGINPKSFLVDVTNYVMLELGQPTHGFDARDIGKISVGNAAGEFTTLQNQEVKVTPEMLFIKSDGKPVALAGVIGGKNSEIKGDTTDVVFEVATFDAVSVRKTAAAIGVRTDSSNRYEKSLDPMLNKLAGERLLYLVGGKAAFNWVGKEYSPKTIKVDKKYLERFCGIKFDYRKVEKNLRGLGFEPVISEKEITVTVPSWRATKDVTGVADIIEEIVRTFGYDNIKPVPPTVELKPVNRVRCDIKETLANKYGFDEVHTYIWGKEPTSLKLVNSFIKGSEYIRNEMIPSILEVAKKNTKNFGDIRIFEVGRVWTGKEEQRRLAIYCGDYKELADMLVDLFGVEFEIGKADKSYLHPKNNATFNGGVIGVVHPSVGSGAVAEIVMRDVVRKIEVTRMSKYPRTTLDFTFVHKGIYQEIKRVFEGLKNSLIMDWKLKDVYGENYTLTFTVGSYDRTLEGAEIDAVWSAIVEHGRKNELFLKE